MKIVNKIIITLMLCFIITIIISPSINAIDVMDYKPSSTYSGADTFYKRLGGIVGVVRSIGIVTAVIALTVIGIKYMLASVDGKAEYKKAMMPVVIGCFFIIGTSTIIGVIDDIGGNITISGSSTSDKEDELKDVYETNIHNFRRTFFIQTEWPGDEGLYQYLIRKSVNDFSDMEADGKLNYFRDFLNGTVIPYFDLIGEEIWEKDMKTKYNDVCNWQGQQNRIRAISEFKSYFKDYFGNDEDTNDPDGKLYYFIMTKDFDLIADKFNKLPSFIENTIVPYFNYIKKPDYDADKITQKYNEWRNSQNS